MKTRILLVGGLVLILGCTTLPRYQHADVPIEQQKREYVDCEQKSQTGAGPNPGILTDMNRQNIMTMCLEGYGWRQVAR
jgi:hypothetical protein